VIFVGQRLMAQTGDLSIGDHAGYPGPSLFLSRVQPMPIRKLRGSQHEDPRILRDVLLDLPHPHPRATTAQGALQELEADG
jgi:hypothetical protein